MKHYSEIIRNIINEDDKKEVTERNDSKQKSKMNAQTFTYNNSVSLSLTASLANSFRLSNLTKTKNIKFHSGVWYFLKKVSTIVYKIIRFAIILIYHILKYTLNV